MNRYERKRQQKQLNNMDKKYTLTFTQREIICMCNAIGVDKDGNPREYRIGDGHILFNVLSQLQPFAAIDTNIPEEKQADPEVEEVFEVDPVTIGTDADGDKEKLN